MPTTADELLFSQLTRLVGGDELSVGEIANLTASLSDTSKALLVRSLLAARNNTGTGYQNVQLGQRNSTDSLPVVIASDQSDLSVRIEDGSGNLLTSSASAPIGSERGLIVRNIPSGIQPVNAASLPLPTGAATEANQTTTNTSLSSIDGKLGTLGQKASAGSAPVVIASDQSAVPASQSGTWNINNISGTVSLPTGAATSANQIATNNILASIDSGIPNSLGQTTSVNSMPVVIASDQSTVKVSIAGYTTPSASEKISPEFDMTGRVKTANATQIIGSQWTYGKLPLTWGETITGTGSVIEPSAQNSSTYLRLTTGTANADSVTFQTRRHFRYQVFRTHSISWAIVFGPQQTNVTKMFGQGLNNNGWFIEQSGGTYYFVVRSNVNVTLPGFNETKVARSSWNLDKLDGTGPSGLNIDLTKGISWIIEFVWHGTQGLKFGINYFDRIIWCHEIKYTGLLSEPFSRNAILPLRAMVLNTGALASQGGEMQVGPVSYNVYGGQEEEEGYIFSSGNKTTKITVSSSTVFSNIFALRPKATVVGANNRAVLIPLSFYIFAADTIYYEVFSDAIIGAGTWTSVDTRSVAEISVNPSTISNERVIQCGYVPGGGKGTISIASGFAGDVFSSIDATNNNTPLCVGVRAVKLGGNADTYVSCVWKEIC